MKKKQKKVRQRNSYLMDGRLHLLLIMSIGVQNDNLEHLPQLLSNFNLH